MAPPVNVLSIATAVPPHQLDQYAVADAARHVYARTFARYPKLAEVFVNAGIERRYSARSLEWLSKPHNLAERTEAYVESASELFVRTAKTALDRAGIPARDVDVVVTVSSTGIATPGSNTCCSGAGIASRRNARAGFWPRLCRRRLWFCARRAACAG